MFVTEDYLLLFDLEPCVELDNFALLACQDYNLGNQSDWFGCFRGGIGGLHARVDGVIRHFHDVHSWRLNLRGPMDSEYHLSSILFNMDSAIECLVFALNALGNAVAPQQFLDVTMDKSLRQVAPWNIVEIGNRRPLEGYTQYFPSLQAHWQANATLLDDIAEQHDVSKHRSMIFHGGKFRSDPPLGFFESLGISGKKGLQFMYSPMEEIVLGQELKSPPSKRKPGALANTDTLEALAEAFCDFINASCTRALDDAKTHIILSNNEFLSLDAQ